MSITSISRSVSGRVAAGALGVAMALTLIGTAVPASAASLSATQISAIVSLLSSFGADQATINNVQAALSGTPSTTTTSTGSTSGASVCPYTWSKTLTVGSTGADVKALQQFLNSSSDTMVAASGAGSVGNETSTFGPATKAAVIKFQNKYAAAVLTPVGLKAGTGYVGASTRTELNTLCSGTTTTTTTQNGVTVTVPSGPGITVTAATQPANSLAPYAANRVPFTTFTLTNNSSQTVTVNSVTVQRTGLGSDNNFAGIVLLDNNGLQVGIAHTLNSNHQVNIGDGFTLAPGQSTTYTVAGNMAALATASANAGQVVSLEVVAINTSVAVTGSLPITGAAQTINATLAIGTVSTSTSSYDPGAAQTKNIGSTGVRFTGVRFTASSAEDVKLMNLRWRQVGTASGADISNVTTYVNGTAYPTVLDSTGKYYTTMFPGGILIPKGNSVDVYVQGDLTGTNSSSRTVQMTIDKATDVYFVGQTYGYGVTFTPVYTTTPSLNGNITTISGGSATSIQNNPNVPSANIPVNVNNTVLGGFTTNFLGEPVSVSSMYFAVATSSGELGQMTSVSIVDQNGNVVAGPVDTVVGDGTTHGGVSTGTTNYDLLHFTDTVTFPVGTASYTLVGKVPSTYANNGTIVLSTTPSSDWGTVTGQTTGNTVSLSGSGTVTMNTMTVKGATLTITASPNPVAQNIVSGGTSVTLANIQLDASQSGEDVRLNSIPLYVETSGSSPAVSNLNTCQLYNGATALNNGNNVVNSWNTAGTDPTFATPGTATVFTFDNAFTVPKGTVTTLALKCNIVSSATGGYQFGVYTSGSYSATGVQSGNSLTSTNLTVTSGGSGVQTVNSKGSLLNNLVTVDASSPSYTVVGSGTTGVTVGVVTLHAQYENINLTKLGLQLTSTASDTTGKSTDLSQVYIYNGTTLVGTVTFTGANTVATSTLTTPVTLVKDADTLLTIKADMATIGLSSSGTEGALVKVDPNSAEGSGVNSGQTIKAGATAGVAGVRLVKSFPTIAQIPLTSTGVVDGHLLRFSITANASGPIGVHTFTFTVSTSTADGPVLSNIGLYGYTDSGFSNPISDSVAAGGVSSSGQIDGNLATTTSQCLGSGTAYQTPAGSNCTSTATAQTLVYKTATNAVEIPAGATRYFELRGSTASVVSGASAVTTLSNDSGFSTSTAALSKNFVWSPNATTTANITSDNDWFDGYVLPGFSSNILQSRSY